jgi:hypothetical protein
MEVPASEKEREGLSTADMSRAMPRSTKASIALSYLVLVSGRRRRAGAGGSLRSASGGPSGIGGPATGEPRPGPGRLPLPPALVNATTSGRRGGCSSLSYVFFWAIARDVAPVSARISTISSRRRRPLPTSAARWCPWSPPTDSAAVHRRRMHIRHPDLDRPHPLAGIC